MTLTKAELLDAIEDAPDDAKIYFELPSEVEPGPNGETDVEVTDVTVDAAGIYLASIGEE